MKRKSFLSVFFALSVLVCHASITGTVHVDVSGIQNGDKVSLSLSSAEYLSSLSVDSDGKYEFKEVPVGLHYVKIEAAGYNLPDSQLVRINNDGSVDPVTGIQLVVTKKDADPNLWTHTWKSDGSIAGYTTETFINKRPEVEFLGKKIIPADVPSSAMLFQNYKILLSDEDSPWTQEYAYRLLETLKTLPVDYDNMKLSKFRLTSEKLTDDLSVTDMGEGKEVSISVEAFYYANPFLVNLDGVRGRFFSKRLHHAMTKYVTDFGNDDSRVSMILQKRFGCDIYVPDYEQLTACTTNESAECFQKFYPSELVAIINMFEELPEGFHITPQLKFLNFFYGAYLSIIQRDINLSMY